MTLSEHYSPVLIDHFERPRNAGAMPDANAEGYVVNPVCGDSMRLFLRIEAFAKENKLNIYKRARLGNLTLEGGSLRLLPKCGDQRTVHVDLRGDPGTDTRAAQAAADRTTAAYTASGPDREPSRS